MHVRAAVSCVAAAAFVLSACGQGVAELTSPTPSAADSSISGIGDAAVDLEDGVVFAKGAANAKGGSDSTVIVGTLRNATSDAIEITGFTTSLGPAPTYAIYDNVDGVVQESDESVIIPAHGAVTLSEDGLHFALTGYEPEIVAGSTLDVTLELNPRQTMVLPGISVRDAKDYEATASGSRP